MAENQISRKLNEITFRKVSLEARIEQEENKLSNEEENMNGQEILDEKIDRLKTLKAIYGQFEDLLHYMNRSTQYNS